MADYWQVIATNGRRQLVMYDAMTDEALARRLVLMLKRQSPFTGIEYYLHHIRTAPAALAPDDLAAHLRETVDELRGE